MFQLILNPTRDWNEEFFFNLTQRIEFQLILNPTRDWNDARCRMAAIRIKFQLILNPTRDWNKGIIPDYKNLTIVPINLKPY